MLLRPWRKTASYHVWLSSHVNSPWMLVQKMSPLSHLILTSALSVEIGSGRPPWSRGQSDDLKLTLKDKYLVSQCLLMVCVGHCLEALEVRCACGCCVYTSGGISLFFSFSLGPGRKQGSNKLAWILHWSAQFHGCCRYPFCSSTHSLKCKFSTKRTVAQ